MTSCEQCLQEIPEGNQIYFCPECKEDYCSKECACKHLDQNVHKLNRGWICITNPAWRILVNAPVINPTGGF